MDEMKCTQSGTVIEPSPNKPIIEVDAEQETAKALAATHTLLTCVTLVLKPEPPVIDGAAHRMLTPGGLPVPLEVHVGTIDELVDRFRKALTDAVTTSAPIIPLYDGKAYAITSGRIYPVSLYAETRDRPLI